ncbi:MAG: leucine-rich repeat domain-containing protein [Saprospiraceae bacterium]
MKAFNLRTALQHPAKTQELYIHGLVLSGFPKEILKLKQLRKLALTRNQLTSIPEAISQLTQLEELIVNENQLRELPASLKMLPKLKIVHLAQNEFSSFPSVLLSCNQLQLISFYANKLDNLPAEISQLQNLRALYLEDNQIPALATTIATLPTLEVLNCAKNRIQRLPKNLGHCKKLKVLNLAHNELRQFVDTVAPDIPLKTLALDGNKLRTFPSAILSCTGLIELSLRKCNLKTIPREINRLQALQYLNLGANKIQTLPESISDLTKLGFLLLEDNKISNLPIGLVHLQRIRRLNISKNPLKVLPINLFELEWLQHLSMLGTWDLQPMESKNITSIPLLAAKHLTDQHQQNSRPATTAIIKFLNDLIYFKQLDKLEISTRYLTKKQSKHILKFIKICRQEKLSDELRLSFFQLSLGMEGTASIPKNILWQALTFKQTTVRKVALQRLQEQDHTSAIAHPLSTKSCLALLGRSPVNTKAIKQRLEKLGLVVKDKYEEMVTHIVLGDFPALTCREQLRVAPEKSFVLLAAHQVTQFLARTENSFLQQKDTVTTQQNLSKLLLSKQEASVTLGLQILQQTTLNPTLLTDLLIVYKTSKSSKHKYTIRKLFGMYLDAPSRRVFQTVDWKKLSAGKLSVAEVQGKVAGSIFEANRIVRYFKRH